MTTPQQCSQAAAKLVRPDTNKMRGVVLAHLRIEGESGATDEQLQDWTYLNPSTERPRRIELVRMGLVKDSGLTRPTRSGRKATVWVAV